jgi:hypothetical protein
VINIWLAKVNIAEHRGHYFAEPVHRLKACGLTHAHALINKTTGNAVRNHARNYEAFSVRSEVNLSGDIAIALELRTMVSHAVENIQKQIS